jgi:hypothetical protein
MYCCIKRQQPHDKESHMKNQILSTAFIALISTSALAEDSASIPFSELDGNGDNALSAAEALSLPDIATQWSDLDKDGNNQLSPEEYTAYSLPAPAVGSQ